MKVNVITTKKRQTYLEQTIDSIKKSEYIEPIEVNVFCDLAEGLTANHIASWTEIFKDLEDDDYGILIQDDMIFSKGTFDLVKLYLKLYRPNLMTLHSNKKQVAESEEQGFYVLKRKQWTGEQAMIIKKRIYMAFLESLKGETFDSSFHDGLLALFLKQKKLDVLAISPCPAQHIGKESSIGIAWVLFGRERKNNSFKGEDFNVYEYVKNRTNSNS